MSLNVRLFLGFFLMTGFAVLLFFNTVLNQVKPSLRQSQEEGLVEQANLLAELVAGDVAAGRVADGIFARALDAAAARQFGAVIAQVNKDRLNYRIYITDESGVVIFDSEGLDQGADYSRWNDVYLTLRGQYGARTTRTDPNDETSTVMHVAAPIRADDGRLLGVLTIAKPNISVEPFLALTRDSLIRGAVLVVAASLVLGLGLSIWFSAGLGKLARYARAVAAGQRVTLPSLPGTELKSLGRSLERMRKELEGRDYVERYVHTLTHEMKSPLAAVRGAAELLRESPAPEDRRRFLDNIQAESDRLQRLVERLLDLAALENRDALEHAEPVDLRRLAQTVIRPRESRATVADVELVALLPERAAMVHGERFLLEQALCNLLDNALDFVPRGGRIELAVCRDDDQWLITVSDDGPGVPDYALARVFERFYSLPRPSTGRKSSGLGLPFVAQVAELHGGRATLANAAAGGAVASVWIPASH